MSVREGQNVAGVLTSWDGVRIRGSGRRRKTQQQGKGATGGRWKWAAMGRVPDPLNPVHWGEFCFPEWIYVCGPLAEWVPAKTGLRAIRAVALNNATFCEWSSSGESAHR
jgi:hypothetical protein